MNLKAEVLCLFVLGHLLLLHIIIWLNFLTRKQEKYRFLILIYGICLWTCTYR